MRLLHTSDWHLGAADGERSLLEDQSFFVDAICRIIRERQVDGLLLAGDVYDRAVASAEAIGLFDRAMTRICREMKIPVLMIAGNHDGAERLAGCNALLADAGLHICGTAARKPTVVTLGDCQIFLLPWLTEERVRSLFPERKGDIRSLEDAYRVLLEAWRQHFLPGKKHLLLAHAFITQAETSISDRAAEIGFATQVAASVFEGFDYVALGHIHKMQDVGANVRYSGTPMPYSFGREEQQEKSVTIVDTSDMSRETVALPLLHRRTTLSGTLTELLAGQWDEDVRQGYVRLQVSDSYVGLETLAQLKTVYPNVLEVSGKSFEAEESSITLSPEELAALETNPMEVFRYFCREEMGQEPEERWLTLFQQALDEEVAAQ